MKTKVFIDGHAGTTGLRIHERLADRSDIELITIDEEHRKDEASIRQCMKAADITFLCLPDAAAVEAVKLAEGCNVRIIDTSTAHRTMPGWTYGFPELSAQQPAAIAQSDRVGNPGCHASGMIAAIQPLIKAGLMPATYPVTAFSLTGYSGGGKKMISQYKDQKADELYAPRQYGLVQQHKHLKEVIAVCGLTATPIFTPIVDDYYSGMEVMVPLFTDMMQGKPAKKDIWQALAAHYEGSSFVHVLSLGEDKGGYIAANALSGYDDMEIIVTGNDDRVVVTTLFDNLGKGASGAAIQNMNIMLGLDPKTGLNLLR
ncbi:MAG: N-acetyl-gamma-glutamyl-phosphate reductase [Megasphaera sp.]|jgi:N-acetyl-gamma-glutamyl-phosphate reductase|nr:N-acetyl-gamma-glutamyl-phosphate reductase [Megasphaera sp.]